MKVIDARSGKELHIGDTIPFSPERKILGVEEVNNFFNLTAKALMEKDGKQYFQKLIVRTDHPAFPNEIVAFYPS